jgi:hypothetical protein
LNERHLDAETLRGPRQVLVGGGQAETIEVGQREVEGI